MITKFFTALSNNEQMRERVLSLNRKYPKGQPIDDAMAAADIAAFATSEGYAFTAEELLAYKPPELGQPI
jgi:hypothetical protein